ncbi:MAG: ribbon-helix-helix domain-containing protein [Thermodesulfobacteriota bacterium]|jgi:predicted DNA-binding protein
MKRTNLHLTDLQIKNLRKLSKKTGLTVAELVRRAVDQFLLKQEKENK